MPHDALWLQDAIARVQSTALGPVAEHRGRVEEIADGVAMISGLPDVRLDELLRFEAGVFGFAQVLEPDRIGCVLLDAIQRKARREAWVPFPLSLYHPDGVDRLDCNAHMDRPSRTVCARGMGRSGHRCAGRGQLCMDAG